MLTVALTTIWRWSEGGKTAGSEIHDSEHGSFEREVICLERKSLQVDGVGSEDGCDWWRWWKVEEEGAEQTSFCAACASIHGPANPHVLLFPRHFRVTLPLQNARQVGVAKGPDDTRGRICKAAVKVRLTYYALFIRLYAHFDVLPVSRRMASSGTYYDFNGHARSTGSSLNAQC